MIRSSAVPIALAAALAAGPAPAAPLPPGAHWVSYESEVDGSDQRFGLYVPNPYDPDVPHPVALRLHGFGGSAGTSFGSFSMGFADDHGWLLVSPHGRGNMFFDGPGERDVFQVLEILRRDWNIDEDRVYLEGASMGATGAYRLAMRYPDRFAAAAGADGWGDYRLWHRHWYAPGPEPDAVDPVRAPLLAVASPVDVAECAIGLPMLLIVDTSDPVVWPANTENLLARFDALRAEAGPGTFPATVHRNPGGGHTAGYDLARIYGFLLDKRVARQPRRVTYATNRYAFDGAYWVRIDRFEEAGRMARIDARVGTAGDGPVPVPVRVENVLRYTLLLTEDLAGGPVVRIETNGVPSYEGPARSVAIAAARSPSGEITGWAADPPPLEGLRKRKGLEGPLGDAFASPFLLVYGDDRDRAEAERFAAEWNGWLGGNVAPVAAGAVPPEAESSRNLILFGTVESNPLIARIDPDLPIHVHEDGVRAGRRWDGAHYGAHYVWPNPRHPDRYVVIRHGRIQGSYDKELEALPWYWPDYAVFDTRVTPRTTVQPPLRYLPDAWVEAGLFDLEWRLASGPALFRRGDANGDGGRDVGDAITVLMLLFAGGSAGCREACDINDDGRLDIGDPIALLNHLFGGEAAPPAPGGTCGEDPTRDDLGCEQSPCNGR